MAAEKRGRGSAPRRGRRSLAFLMMLGLLAFGYGGAGAQSSGGAMGGGDWDSHSSSRSRGDDSSRSGSTDYDYSGGSRSSYDGGAGCSQGEQSGDGGGEWILIAIGGGLLLLLVRYIMEEHDRREGLLHTPAPDLFDVTAIRIVLDARARGAVQAALDRLGETAGTGSAAGRVKMLNEVAILLRRHRAAWVYGAVANHPMTTKDEARAAFHSHVATARASYRDETIRNVDGKVTRADAHAVAASAEGPGLVMVSVLVAADRELVTVDRPGDGEALRRALEALSSLTPTSLIAVEVVWTPSEPADRMTSAEVERLLAGTSYAKIDGALAGVAVCEFCQGLYPAEAFACVHCGAPPRGRAGAP
ncbi:MAG: DUF1517 domain-containing protein [Myxococcales bacterium]|nr:DUF1517 domain-containing protein [Myxococcales bacterium]MBK7192696.1 DUF1517 domain-containing protein [Myxococcales bacterium]MBP6845382.1 DUF1517 domain-containing protein [Kofleriaceae bacterium]